MTKADTVRDDRRCYICGGAHAWCADCSGFNYCELCIPFVKFAHNILTLCSKYGICHPGPDRNKKP